MARFEIRQLKPEHKAWAQAIVCHSNLFYSPMWVALYPEVTRDFVIKLFHSCEYLVRHQIDSGLSFGVFDTEYEYKRPESAATEGKLYWEEEEEGKEGSNEKDGASASQTKETLLHQMDFHLVSIALAYDAQNALDLAQLQNFLHLLPQYGSIVVGVEALDKRDASAKEATRSHQLLKRAASSTRADYENKGLMKLLAHFMMRQAAAQGYGQIQIETAHDAVFGVWSHPPEPFTAEVPAVLDPVEFFVVEKGEGEAGDGAKKVYPLLPAKQKVARVVVNLL